MRNSSRLKNARQLSWHFAVSQFLSSVRRKSNEFFPMRLCIIPIECTIIFMIRVWRSFIHHFQILWIDFIYKRLRLNKDVKSLLTEVRVLPYIILTLQCRLFAELCCCVRLFTEMLIGFWSHTYTSVVSCQLNQPRVQFLHTTKVILQQPTLLYKQVFSCTHVT